jgi:vanillate/4-hydroxybenzoate decarboxylase subunit D
MNEKEQYVSVEREPVEGACSECGEERLMRYPVLSEGGWYDVVKCQSCLHSESREGDPVGPIALPSVVLL